MTPTDRARGDGIYTDLATGAAIDAKKPEEIVRQEYEKMLKEDYGYEYGSMAIEVPIQMGGGGKRGRPRADIVIYASCDPARRDQFKDIVGIVETKKPDQREGVRQLMSYMAATCCRWGVWTNGKRIAYVYKNPTTGELQRDFMYQIPHCGERLEDMGRITKAGLVPTNNLKPIFRRLLGMLYTNTNISRREKLGNELIRLIFCKIWDEKYYPERMPKFRVGPGEDSGTVRARIDELFADVKKELVDDGVFDTDEKIALEDKSVAHVVGELQKYALLKTDKDMIGDAFEVFAESKLVGEKGEFFTPREVVRTAVEFVDPRPNQTVLDPACGSGGFLIYALEHMWSAMDRSPKYRDNPNIAALKKEMAERCFFGIDKELDLVKIAKAYMAIVGDGRGSITQQNTLHGPGEFERRAKHAFVGDDGTLKKFDVVLTNPPFGSKIKVLEEDAREFELGRTGGGGGTRKGERHAAPRSVRGKMHADAQGWRHACHCSS